MVQYVVLGLLLQLGIACRSTKFKREQFSADRQDSYVESQNRQWELFDYMDSTGRYWYLKTDSAFYYHPDSGLWGKQGAIALWESRVKRKGGSRQADSSYAERLLEEQYSGKSSYFKKWKMSTFWWGLGVVFLLAGYLWYRWR